MNPTSPFIVIISLLIALLVTKCVTFMFKIALKPVKYNSIDGLRGYLAFFVFLHHSSVYYFFLSSWNWTNPPSNLYTHLGQTSVSLFFMITGFLFFTKLIDSKDKKIDWLHFFVSRVLRLYPLYLFVFSMVICVVFIMSNFTILEPIRLLIKEIKDWLLFATINSPNINAYTETNGIMAGVIWSIKYEWLFYFSLPIIGLILFKIRSSEFVILLSVFFAFYLFYFTPTLSIHFYTFLSGFIAAILAKNDFFLKIARHFLSSFVIIICLFSTVYFFETAYLIYPLILTTIAFCLIASGNTLFGLLTLSVSRQIGQLSYSIYLLHTTLLFILFRVIIGIETASKFSAFQFWLICLGFGAFLILISFITYYFIELPSINASFKVAEKIRKVKNKFLKNFYDLIWFQKL